MTPQLKILLIFTLFIPSFLLGANLTSFSPEGKVKNVRQVRAQFDDDMIPFGDLTDSVKPFSINCPVMGKARWADTKNWMYDFETELPAGTRCVFKLKANLKTFSGKSVYGKREWILNTGGASIFQTRPYENSSYVQEDQAFILVLDGEIRESSVLKNAYFKVDGLEEKIALDIVQSDLAKKIIEKSYFYGDAEKAPKVVVKPRRVLPSGTEFSIVWGKGITTLSGITTQSDQVLSFKTREPLTLRLTCRRNKPNSPCSPLEPIFLRFSNQVPNKFKGEILVKDHLGKEVTVKFHGYDDHFDSFSIRPPHRPQNEYSISFRESPTKLRDEDGRRLSNESSFPIVSKIDNYPPLLKFAAKFGIIEHHDQSMIPVTVRSIESGLRTGIVSPKELSMMDKLKDFLGMQRKSSFEQAKEVISWMQELQSAEEKDSLLIGKKRGKELKIPRTGPEKGYEVIGIPLKEKGFYVLELNSKNLNENYDRDLYVKTAVLATNMAVHLKWGIDNTLVWVTNLSTNEVIPQADVVLYDGSGVELGRAKTNGAGVAKFEGPLDTEFVEEYYPSREAYQKGVYAFAHKKGDMAFVHSSWQKGIETFRYGYRWTAPYGNTLATAVTDRPLYRAGQTVHINAILRSHHINDLKLPSDLLLEKSKQLIIKFGWDYDSYETELDLKWDDLGQSEVRWTIPKSANLGTYRILLRDKNSKEEYKPELELASFRVEEFKVPLSKANIFGPKEKQIRPGSIKLDFGVEYLSGGGAGLLPFSFRYKFTKVRQNSNKNSKLVGFDWDGGPFVTEKYKQESTEMTTFRSKLDTTGNGSIIIDKFPSWKTQYRLETELEYKDPNGEIKGRTLNIPIFQSDLKVGIKPDSWLPKDGDLKIHAAVTDQSGNPLENKLVKIRLIKVKNLSHRKKLVGGFYGYSHTKELKPLGVVCEGETDKSGLYLCEHTTTESGNIIAQIEVEDEATKQIQYGHTSLWVPGGDQWWFPASNTDRMDILPEQKEYSPGDMAKFQIQSPFREGKVLITVEREGIIDYMVKDINGRHPVINIPIKPNYAPNVYITMLAIRGRVSDFKPTAIVDLGRPSYKFGFSELKVGWKKHRLLVDVNTDKESYKTRELVKGKVKVNADDDSPLDENSEVIISVVDQGLLQLMSNQSWDVLTQMMGKRPNNVETSTAQMQVVGKRHYGKKALPAGGGGGEMSSTRELFDTLIYWKTKTKLNDKGEAEFSFPTNDSITQFKIAVVAVSGASKFGTGFASIKNTKDLSIYSGIPAIARQNDSLNLEFTLRNTKTTPVEVDFSIDVNKFPKLGLQKKIKLDPSSAKVVTHPLVVPEGITQMSYIVSAKQGDDVLDQAQFEQVIFPDVPVRVIQTHFEQINNQLELPIQKPKDSLPNKGGVRVKLDRTLAVGLDSVKTYMKRYPYQCLEQKISKAVVAADREQWKKIMDEIHSYQDDKGFLKFFPSSSCGSSILTAYVLRLSHMTGWEMPDSAKDKSLDALKLVTNGTFACGIKPRGSKRLDGVFLNAIEALSRYGLAHQNMFQSLQNNANLLPNYSLINFYNILNRTNFDQGPKKDKLLAEITNILFSRLNYQSSVLSFSDPLARDSWYYLTSESTNTNYLILSMLEFKQKTKEIPKLLLSSIGRMQQGRWDLTTGNTLGVLAVKKFSEQFEGESLSGKTSIALDDRQEYADWDDKKDEHQVHLNWPESKKSKLLINHNGKGKPWSFVYSEAALELKAPLTSGFSIQKAYHPIRQKSGGKWSVGDIIEVKLSIKGQADSNWVVLNDPIPAGATIMGKGIGDAVPGVNSDSQGSYPSFVERAFDGLRAYYDYIFKGEFSYSYSMRLNTAGVFKIPPTRVEAMYHPEYFGEIPNSDVVIAE